jgi:hypothetical protein
MVVDMMVAMTSGLGWANVAVAAWREHPESPSPSYQPKSSPSSQQQHLNFQETLVRNQAHCDARAITKTIPLSIAIVT